MSDRSSTSGAPVSIATAAKPSIAPLCDRRGVGVGALAKVCGVTDLAGARAVAAARADFMGVILSPGFARSVPATRAQGLFGEFGGVRVGVFVDADGVSRTAEQLGLDVVQLHGGESPEEAARIADDGPWLVWKSVCVRPGESMAGLAGRVAEYRDAVDGVLADAWDARAPGGTGRRFRWPGVGEAVRGAAGGACFVAAGGLGPGNVSDAVRLLAPDVVDASSGVESAPGKKDPARTRAFVDAARAAAPSGSGP